MNIAATTKGSVPNIMVRLERGALSDDEFCSLGTVIRYAAPQRTSNAMTTIVDGEVRSRLAAMAPDARRAALADAVRAGDDLVVGAALGGPAMLSGFADRAEQEEFRRQWQTAARGPELNRIERIEKALVHVDRAGGLLITYATTLTDEKMIVEAEESERVAQVALSG